MDDIRKVMKKNHILIVDDDHRIGTLLSQYLSKHGYLITVVTDTKLAREALKTFKFDLIILDVLLPKELGTEFAQDLRKVSRIAILMLTAMGTPEERIKGLEAGADDYMSKPFDPKELLLRIEKLIARTKENLSEKSNYVLIGSTKLDIYKNTLITNEGEYPLQVSEKNLLNIL